MSPAKRGLWFAGAWFAGSAFLSALYLGIVSLAESPQHAFQLFQEDQRIVVPIIVGFGLQTALYIALRKRLFVPVTETKSLGALTGAGGATSTAAMVACCAHHLTDVLPVLGLTAATAFLAEYRMAFMLLGLGTTLVGIVVMLVILLRERRKGCHMMAHASEAI